MASSMGQQGNRDLKCEDVQRDRYEFKLADPELLMRRLVPDAAAFKVKAGMIPQYSLIFVDRTAAEAHLSRLRAAVQQGRGMSLDGDVNGSTLTVTVTLDPTGETYNVGGRELGYRELGFTRMAIDDHHSGMHHPEGSLIVFNDERGYFASRLRDEVLDYLVYAPALREYFH